MLDDKNSVFQRFVEEQRKSRSDYRKHHSYYVDKEFDFFAKINTIVSSTFTAFIGYGIYNSYINPQNFFTKLVLTELIVLTFLGFIIAYYYAKTGQRLADLALNSDSNVNNWMRYLSLEDKVKSEQYKCKITESEDKYDSSRHNIECIEWFLIILYGLVLTILLFTVIVLIWCLY